MSAQTDIADAVTKALNDGSWSLDFTAQRKRRSRLAREEMGSTLYVAVIPASTEETLFTRGATQKTHTVDVVIQKAVSDPDDNAEIDALEDFQEELAAAFKLVPLADYPAAQWQATLTLDGAEAGYIPEHLDQHAAYTGVIRLVYVHL